MRIAVAQMPGTRLDDWRASLALIDDLVRRAASLRADLAVFPECAWPAYCLGSREAYGAARDAGLPGPDWFLTHVRELARTRRIALCVGYVAEDGGRLLNSAALIGRDGRPLGRHDKCFLWDFDHDYFAPGDRLEPVDTEFGRVGLMVCADARLPEIPATLAARGTELLLQPTAWVNAGAADAPWNPQPEFLIPARAAELGVPVASASKWGREGDTTFVGSSLICDADGRVLAQCGPAETAVVAAEVEPRSPRCAPVTDVERNVLLASRPPTLPRADVGPLELSLAPPAAGSEDAPNPPVVRARSPADLPQASAVRTGPWQPVAREGVSEIAGVRIGVLAANETRSFAPARCLALQGVHAIVVYAGETMLSQRATMKTPPRAHSLGGGRVSLSVLRARACENRVFVVAADTRGWRVIDPRGLVTKEGPWPADPRQAITLTLDVAQAANKAVTTDTDVIGDRRPEQYAFTGT